MSDDIVASATAIAVAWRVLAAAWHVIVAGIGITLMVRRIDARWMTAALSVMLFSVAAMAWWSGNPFNTTVFSGAGTAAVLLSATSVRTWVRRASDPEVTAGTILCGFGWMYPHFLTGPDWQYLYAAPLGLLPCPTLAFIIGVSLLTNSFGSTPWAILFASLGLFYGVTGVFVLGVAIDWLLLAGAAILAAAAFRRTRRVEHAFPFIYRRTT